MSIVKKVAGIAVIVILLLALLPQVAIGQTSQTWYLNNSNANSPYSLSQTSSPNSGDKNLSSSPSKWISDQSADGDVAYNAGNWTGRLQIEPKDLSTSDIQIEIGYYTNSAGTGTFSSLTGSVVKTRSGTNVNFTIASGQFDLPQGAYLAIIITLNPGRTGTISAGAGHSNFTTPEAEISPPVPELSTIVLFGCGVAGLGTFIFIRRKKIFAH